MTGRLSQPDEDHRPNHVVISELPADGSVERLPDFVTMRNRLALFGCVAFHLIMMVVAIGGLVIREPDLVKVAVAAEVTSQGAIALVFFRDRKAM